MRLLEVQADVPLQLRVPFEICPVVAKYLHTEDLIRFYKAGLMATGIELTELDISQQRESFLDYVFKADMWKGTGNLHCGGQDSPDPDVFPEEIFLHACIKKSVHSLRSLSYNYLPKYDSDLGNPSPRSLDLKKIYRARWFENLDSLELSLMNALSVNTLRKLCDESNRPQMTITLEGAVSVYALEGVKLAGFVDRLYINKAVGLGIVIALGSLGIPVTIKNLLLPVKDPKNEVLSLLWNCLARFGQWIVLESLTLLFGEHLMYFDSSRALYEIMVSMDLDPTNVAQIMKDIGVDTTSLYLLKVAKEKKVSPKTIFADWPETCSLVLRLGSVSKEKRWWNCRPDLRSWSSVLPELLPHQTKCIGADVSRPRQYLGAVEKPYLELWLTIGCIRRAKRFGGLSEPPIPSYCVFQLLPRI